MRDQNALARTFAHDASYMVDVAENPVDRTLEYSRPFRSLKLWTAFRAHGAEGFRSALESNLAIARGLAEMVREHPDLELVVEPQLSIVPFRHVPAVGSVDAHNAELARRMQEEGDVYVTSAVVDGHTVLRPCITNFRTTQSDVAALIETVLRTGRALNTI